VSIVRYVNTRPSGVGWIDGILRRGGWSVGRVGVCESERGGASRGRATCWSVTDSSRSTCIRWPRRCSSSSSRDVKRSRFWRPARMRKEGQAWRLRWVYSQICQRGAVVVAAVCLKSDISARGGVSHEGCCVSIVGYISESRSWKLLELGCE